MNASPVRHRSTTPSILALVVATLLLPACGAPRESSVHSITAVPYGLLSPSSPPPSLPVSAPAGGPALYLVGDDELVRSSAGQVGSTTTDGLAQLLRALMRGPSDRERLAGLSTALNPDVDLALVSLVGGRATIDIRAGQLPTGPGRLPLAVGQLVLTATSFDDVTEVVLTTDGTRIPAPLPGGALTDRPLSAGDYARLVRTGTPSPSGTATSG